MSTPSKTPSDTRTSVRKLKSGGSCFGRRPAHARAASPKPPCRRQLLQRAPPRSALANRPRLR